MDGTEPAARPGTTLALCPAGAEAAPKGATAAAVATLPPQRAGDPLGLGLAPGARPAAPPDPDAYDRDREDAEYARSLLSAADLADLDAEYAEHGAWTIHQVRALIAEQTTKGSLEEGGLDPEIMALIDARTDYKIFVAGDSVHTREELYDAYPFHEFGVQPEAVFAAQEIGVFPPRPHAARAGPEYLARDVGDESLDFMPVEDLIRRAAARPGARHEARTPARIVKTKIYIGKQHWRDFEAFQRVCCGAVRIAKAAALGDALARPSPLLALFGGPAAAPLALAGSPAAGPDASELRRLASELCRREEAVCRREEEVAQRLEDAARAWRLIEIGMGRAPAAAAAAAAPGREPGAHTN